jgi:hypothetical protein
LGLSKTQITDPLPNKGCSQVVLGRSESLGPYYKNEKTESNGDFKVLSVGSNYSVELNQKYISCGIDEKLAGISNCEYPFRILIPKKNSNICYEDDKSFCKIKDNK